MRRASKGFTIIEVSIFLAISLALTVSAWNLISGKQAEAEFDTKMRDTQSKIQDWINDVSTGNTGGDPSQQACVLSLGRPQVNNGSPSANPACVFLGKAIQFTTQPGANSDKIYAYSVFGCREASCKSIPTSTDVLPSSVAASSPKAADGFPAGQSLTETFELASVEVKKLCYGPDPPCSPQDRLIGFYNSLNTQNQDINNPSNGAEDINVYVYPLTNNYPINDPQIDNCLQWLGICSTTTLLTKSYAVCFTDGSRTAEITITSKTGIGATTDLEYKAC